MTNTSANSKRIVKNTLLLYVRMLFMMAVSLYTSRVVLNALGVEDFGIYNVVGGVVAMFSMLSGSLSAAITRFITYALGTGNKENLKKIFSSSVTIQIGLAVLIILLAEAVGVWFLNVKMNIPDARMAAANWVFQFSILTFAINLISVPYNASIIAHERMSAFAYISILEVVAKLVIVYLLLVSPIDKLIFYAILMGAVALIIRFVYGCYCKRHFEECTYHFIFDKELLKKMFGFAGWNFIGASLSSATPFMAAMPSSTTCCGPTAMRRSSSSAATLPLPAAMCASRSNCRPPATRRSPSRAIPPVSTTTASPSSPPTSTTSTSPTGWSDIYLIIYKGNEAVPTFQPVHKEILVNKQNNIDFLG